MPHLSAESGGIRSCDPRRFRFSLKSMMVVAAVSSIGLGVFFNWYKSHGVLRRKIWGLSVEAKRELLDLLWEPTDSDFIRRATGIRCNQQPFTDAMLADLSRLSNPQFIDLSGTEVTDRGLIDLKEMANVRIIDLGGTKITDAGLAHLKSLVGLRGVSLMGTEASPGALDELQRALPNVKIWRTQRR